MYFKIYHHIFNLDHISKETQKYLQYLWYFTINYLQVQSCPVWKKMHTHFALLPLSELFIDSCFKDIGFIFVCKIQGSWAILENTINMSPFKLVLKI